MIKINLLPEELRGHESSFTKMKMSFKLQGRSVRNMAIGIILTLAIVHVSLFFIGERSAATYRSMSQKYKGLLPGKRECDALKAEVSVTNKKAKAIEGLMADRFSWAKKLNDLSDSLAPGTWLTAVTYEEKPAEILAGAAAPSAKPGAKKDAAKADARKANVGYLNISGYASSMGEQGTALVGKFIKNMKDDNSFFSDFSDVKLESIKSEKVLEQEVMSFQITCQFKK